MQKFRKSQWSLTFEVRKSVFFAFFQRKGNPVAMEPDL